MAVLPTIKRIQRSDLGGNIPTWLDGVLSPLNQFMEEIYSALNKNITIPENVKAQIKVLNFRTPSNYTSAKGFNEITYLNTLNKKTEILLVGGITKLSEPNKKFDAVFPSWYDNNNGTLSIRYISGLENSTEYDVTMIGF